MGITKDRGRWYWVKRVPKRFEGLVVGSDGKPVKQVRQALHTDSETEARAKAAQIEAARLAEWEALRAGDAGQARAHYEAARELAQHRGFRYVPMDSLAGGDLADLLSRVLSLAEGGKLTASPQAAEAVLGAVPEALPDLAQVLEDYFTLTRARHVKKSPAQKARWEKQRRRVVRHFLEVVAPRDAHGAPIAPAVDRITRADALKFRAAWVAKVESGMAPNTANREIGILAEIFKTWNDRHAAGLENPFTRLSIEGEARPEKPAFSRDFVAQKLLAPGALSGLNTEARDILLILVNTGLRPSEVTDAPLSDFVLDADIPFLRVAAHGRELKVAHTARDIPLLGVSLAAATRVVAAGGVKRYAHKASGWSALVNKYLGNNGLKETPAHTAYSLRHYVENALLASGADDRVRADILGHKYARPKYGDGGALPARRAALARIAL
ncbi:integrase [Dinoroseobacter phage vB_DshS-R4C]|nr:integrase [Dinoroseobacter phage vB_DshS-R4C]